VADAVVLDVERTNGLNLQAAFRHDDDLQRVVDFDHSSSSGYAEPGRCLPDNRSMNILACSWCEAKLLSALRVISGFLPTDVTCSQRRALTMSST